MDSYLLSLLNFGLIVAASKFFLKRQLLDTLNRCTRLVKKLRHLVVDNTSSLHARCFLLTACLPANK
jgi:hypothetical protein